VEFEFEGVERDLFDGFLDFEVDVDCALVFPRLASLEVEEGDGVV